MQQSVKSAPTAGLSILGAALALGLIVAASIGAGALARIKAAADTIAVKGYAEQRIRSDVATWRGRYARRAVDLTEVYKALAADRTVVLEFLTERGIAAGDVQFSPVVTQANYRWNEQGMMTGEVAGYELSQMVEVTSQDVDMIAELAADASVLIESAVEFYGFQPEYYSTGLDAIKIELIGAATRDARRRAEQFAEASGVVVGPLKSAAQGVFQITPVYSTDTEDFGRYDTSTIEKAVKAVVTITFGVAAD